MQQSQALILMSQMKRIEKDNDIRLSNALYLDKKLKEIPGIVPYKLANGATRAVYHLYPFRYIKEKFNNIPKEKFIKALNAEGIPASGGYGKQNKDLLFEEAFNSEDIRGCSLKQGSNNGVKRIICPEMTRYVMKLLAFTRAYYLAAKAIWMIL